METTLDSIGLDGTNFGLLDFDCLNSDGTDNGLQDINERSMKDERGPYYQFNGIDSDQLDGIIPRHQLGFDGIDSNQFGSIDLDQFNVIVRWH